ncbi:helix-turn-helix domain-containing protein [Nocardioides exalbidus]|uniref:helix-turn-helix domain-containing protein n=1 Tax=Nocardioides exalbidus TaxID=402596 RepID=UPI0015875541|nr:helix-turn-helix transcriptional regulator [Nocardioides exalbidus]
MRVKPLPESDVVRRVEGAMLQARDGRGQVIRVASRRGLDDGRRTAARLRAEVIDVQARPGLRSIACGALVEALSTRSRDTPGGGMREPALSVTAPRRSLDRLVRSLGAVLTELSSSAPVVVVVHDEALLDPWSRRWLADVDASASSGVVWILVESAEVETGSDDGAQIGTEVAPADVLSGDGLRVARVLAAAYVGLEAEELQAVTGLDRESAGTAIVALQDAGLVATLQRQHVLVGEDVRTAVLGHLPTALVLGIKREVVSFKAKQAGLAPFLADAALELVHLGDREIIDLLADAMAATALSDPEAAADYGLAAIEHVDSSSDRLGALVWDLLPLLWRTARREEARRLVSRIFIERGQAEAEARVLMWLARLEPSPAEALEHTRAGLALRDVSDLTRSRLLSVQLRCLSTLGRAAEVDEQLPAALELAIASGDPDSISRLRTCDAIRHFYRGAFTTAAHLTETAESEWRASGARQENRVPEMIWAPHLAAVFGQPEVALRRVTGLLEQVHLGREALASPLLHAERSQVMLALGRIEDARDEAVVAAGQWERVWGTEVGVSDRLAAILLAVRVKVAWHRGERVDLAEVKQVLARSTPAAGTESAKRLDWYRFLVDDVDGFVGRDRLVDPENLQVVPWLDPSDEVMIVRALLMQGFRWTAEQQVQRARERAARDGGDHLFARTIDAHLRGMFEWRRDLLEKAVVGWQELARPLLVQHARSDLGSKLLEDGQPGGLEMMLAAQTELAALGAHRDAWRIRQYLRLRGFQVDQAGAEALTPMEARVAQTAVLTGHTVSRMAHDLGLSPHTVSTHLRHIYLKLGITSRAELSAWADDV